MRLSLVTNCLSYGGAERVLSSMANWWASRAHDVSFITLDTTDTDFYPLHPTIRRVALNLAGDSPHIKDKIQNNVQRTYYLRRAIVNSSPDAVISFMDRVNVLTLLATWGTRIPVFVSERGNPNLHPIGKGWTRLRQFTYPQAAAVVLQTEAMAKWAKQEVPSAKTAVIPNPLWAPILEPREAEPTAIEDYRLMAMGRLIEAKGFDLLIDAFWQLSSEFANWKLAIFGEGPERQGLQAKIENLGLTSRIVLAGLTKNPIKEMAKSHVFVLSSRVEGLPNALLEAMACALPVVAFDCNFGPREVLRGGQDGVLVPAEDVGALIVALRELMGNAPRRLELSQKSATAASRYALEPIMARWTELIQQRG